MGMNVPSEGGGDAQVMSEINTTPLVDVMLVLLIIFLITVPVINQAIKVELPDAANLPTQTKPENIVLAVDREGGLYWGIEPVSTEEILNRLKEKAVVVPQPEVHIRADRDVRYEFVGKIQVLCQRAGIAKVGFITQPAARGG